MIELLLALILNAPQEPQPDPSYYEQETQGDYEDAMWAGDSYCAEILRLE